MEININEAIRITKSKIIEDLNDSALPLGVEDLIISQIINEIRFSLLAEQQEEELGKAENIKEAVENKNTNMQKMEETGGKISDVKIQK